MSRTSSARVRCALVVWALLVLLPGVARAQTGRIAGQVLDQQRSPVYGAQVRVDVARYATLTNEQGRFTIASVPVGTHQVTVRMLGFREASVSVDVREGATTDVSIVLEGSPIQLGGITTTASRGEAERITEAPASITTITTATLDNAVGPTWGGALKEVKGLDFIQVGITSVAINARGFNSSFNNRMLMMEDGRIAVLPENGLPVGQFTAIPKVDLAGVEVLVGPGAALYGADASNGVVTLITKDPRQYQGTTFEVTGGSRSFRDIQGRHAGVFGNWGYKITGEYQDANDWFNKLRYGAAQLEEQGVNGDVDWSARVVRGSGALVYYGERSRVEFSGGMSETDGVGQTNVGRNQLDGWQYNFAQLKATIPNWYFSAYRTQSKAGDSYAINRYTENRANPANAALSNREVMLLSDWPSDGQLYAAEAQNSFRFAPLLNTRVVWGGQYRYDIVSSDRQWLTDRLTGEDLKIDQKGVYLQTETPVQPWLDLVLAGRYDDHENYDAQFSPKAGLVIKPVDDQAFRVTYNRAFKSPTTLQTNFYIPDWTAIIAIFGNTEGFTQRDGGGTVLRAFDPLRPEENQTWEVGYKGVLQDRLFVDVAAYRSNYKRFLSPLAVIANPFAATPTFAYDGSGQQIRNEANLTPIVLTYYNLGKAKVTGLEAGVNFAVMPKLTLNGTASYLKLNSVDVEAGREEATSLNSPNTSWTLGANAVDIAGFGGSAVVRHVNSYYFRSGINMGVIPTFTTLDLSVNYRIRPINTLLNVGVANLFTCAGTHEYLPASQDPFRTKRVNKDRKCGVDEKHTEMINMPQIGTMLFVGMRFHTPGVMR